MNAALIHDRGRGPELIGTRMTVVNLLPDFLDSTATESEIARRYDLTCEQVAAARAFAFQNPIEILAEHLRIEARNGTANEAGRAAAPRTDAVFADFREWLAARHAENEHGVRTETEVTARAG